jgi:hypothetical protein
MRLSGSTTAYSSFCVDDTQLCDAAAETDLPAGECALCRAVVADITDVLQR